jgi:acyl-coenzyme A thioesterase PaaI-like protein
MPSPPEGTMPHEFHLPLIQPGLGADLARAIEEMPASRLIGLRVSGFAPGGLSVLEAPITPALTFDGKVVQAGIIGMLADYAGVSAAHSTLPPGWAASTTGFQVHNVAPALGERLVALGTAEQVGRSHAVSSVRVWALQGEGATLVALATVTCRPFEVRPR